MANVVFKVSKQCSSHDKFAQARSRGVITIGRVSRLVPEKDPIGLIRTALHFTGRTDVRFRWVQWKRTFWVSALITYVFGECSENVRLQWVLWKHTFPVIALKTYVFGECFENEHFGWRFWRGWISSVFPSGGDDRKNSYISQVCRSAFSGMMIANMLVWRARSLFLMLLYFMSAPRESKSVSVMMLRLMSLFLILLDCMSAPREVSGMSVMMWRLRPMGLTLVAFDTDTQLVLAEYNMMI